MGLLTLGFAALMSTIGAFGVTNSGCSEAAGWAIPANTLLLVILAFIQQAHYRRTAQVERIVDKRSEQIWPPPDGIVKRSDDPIPPPPPSR